MCRDRTPAPPMRMCSPRISGGWSRIAGAVFCIWYYCFAPYCRAATPIEVDAAISRAQAWLFSHENDGNWEQTPAPAADIRGNNPTGGQWTGVTALAADALVSSGVNESDP